MMNPDLSRRDGIAVPEVMRGLLESRDWSCVRQGIELAVASGRCDVVDALAKAVVIDECGALTHDWFGAAGIRVKQSVRTQLALLLLAHGPSPRLASVEMLDLSELENLIDIEQLRCASKLRVLRMNGCKNLRSGAALGSLARLEALSITGCPVLADFPQAGLEGLQSLSADIEGINSLAPLRGLTGLRSLDVKNSEDVTDVSPLENLRGLRSLRMHGVGAVELGPLSCLVELEELEFDLRRSTPDLAPLARLPRLRSILITGYGGDAPIDLGRLLPDGSLPALESLMIPDAQEIAGLDQIRGGAALREIRLSDRIGIRKFIPNMDFPEEGEGAVRGLAVLIALSAARRFGAESDAWERMRSSFEEAVRRGGPAVAELLLGTWQHRDDHIHLASSSPLRRVAQSAGDAWLDDAVVFLVGALGWRGIGEDGLLDLSRMRITSHVPLRSLPKGTRVRLANSVEHVV